MVTCPYLPLPDLPLVLMGTQLIEWYSLPPDCWDTGQRSFCEVWPLWPFRPLAPKNATDPSTCLAILNPMWAGVCKAFSLSLRPCRAKRVTAGRWLDDSGHWDMQEPGSATVSPSGVPRLTIEAGWNGCIHTCSHRHRHSQRHAKDMTGKRRNGARSWEMGSVMVEAREGI